MALKSEKPNILDIANALGVSKSTVSRAISGKGRIGVETTERIMQYIQENHYRPNSIAKSFSESKTYNIGVVLPHDHHLLEMPFFQACLLGISREITKFDYDVLVITVDENDISNLERIVENHKVDGIILTRLLVDDPQIDYLKKKDIPFLVIGSTDESDIITVDSDNQKACYGLTHELLTEGFKKVALLLGNRAYVVNESRYLGYKEALIHQNVTLNEALVYFNINENSEIDAAVYNLLREEVDLILCGDDYICSRVLNFLDYHEMHVPTDIKVASFYNSQTLENHFPPTTVVNFDIMQVGKTAGEAMIQMIQGKKMYKTLLDNYELLIRESTK